MNDWSERARERLGPARFDFFAGGAGREETLAANEAAWGRWRLLPHVLRDVSTVSTATTVLGTPVALPILAAPVGYLGLVHDDAECAVAAATGALGTLPVISTRASTTLEAIAGTAAGRPWWLQTYVLRDRARTYALVDHAVALGCAALVVTVDTPYVATKPRDLANGFVVPAALRPQGDDAGADQDPALGPADLADLAARSGCPVVAKGVLRGDDARALCDSGVAGIVVSNHGGRQLDGAVATADALEGVVAAVAGRAEVYVDGGIRSGPDVLRALALGARAVLVGRPVVWGLAVGGADGVGEVLGGLGGQLRETMALAGACAVDEVRRDLLCR